MNDGAVHGPVKVWLRLEGLLAFLLATYVYANAGGSWLLFGVLLFAPDVSFVAYLAGRESEPRSTTPRIVTSARSPLPLRSPPRRERDCRSC